MAYITIDDLSPFATIAQAKAQAMIADAVAQAILAAPCLADESDLDADQKAAVRAVLRQAILRWNDSGTGAFQQQTAGPFSVAFDTRATRRALFWPSELEQLQAICAAVTGASDGGAYGVDTAWSSTAIHADDCALVFGATYCSCGSALNGGLGPLWGSA